MPTEQQIIQSIRWKRSPEYCADRLGIDVDLYNRLRSEAIEKYGRANIFLGEIESDLDTFEYITALEGKIIENINMDSGTGTLTGLISDRPLSPEEIEVKYKIDKSKWRLSAYWNKEQTSGKYLVSANITQLKPGQIDPETYQKNFQEFLNTYRPQSAPINSHYQPTEDKECVALILPKQDAHFNKYDIMGKNNIHYRFEIIRKHTEKLLKKTSATNYIEEIVYVVGSDQFNSEWTGTTTKGTNQVNILTYEGGFVEICNHEVSIINMLLEYAGKVHVKFIPGNHDQYVGWHLISWLQAYYREQSNIHFDSSILNRKYHKFGNTAIMLNHGDVLKANELAHKFPIEYKEKWSQCDHYICLVGDKHHELSKDVHGIKFYQVPQLSNARGYWDDKQGHTCSKAEMLGFVITQANGISDILKEILQ
jgi:hypothetical protein